VDYAKAFVKVGRDKVQEILEIRGIPLQVIRLEEIKCRKYWRSEVFHCKL
jgi:hypothetical protein